MRILKQGKRPDDTPLQGTCHYCKTVVEFMQQEGTRAPDDPRDQRSSGFWYIACPTCGAQIIAYVK